MPDRELVREAVGSGVGGTARQPDSSIRLHAGQRLSGHSGVSLQTG